MLIFLLVVALVIIVYLFYKERENKDSRENYDNIKNELRTLYDNNMPNFKKLQAVVNKEVVESIKADDLNQKQEKLILHSLQGGKKIRPVIMYSIYRRLNRDDCYNSYNSLKDASVCVELIHSASLIFDDIMDEDYERRGKKTLHALYGVTYAQLVGMQMMALAFKRMFNSIRNLLVVESVNKDVVIFILGYISQNINKLSSGQFLDVDLIYSLIDKKDNKEYDVDVKDIIDKKTGSLFELSYSWTWLILNYKKDKDILLKELRVVEDISRKFGLLFQISDDFEDVDQDMRKNKKNSIINFVIHSGKEGAREFFYQTKDDFIHQSKRYNLYSPEIAEIVEYLTKKVELYYR